MPLAARAERLEQMLRDVLIQLWTVVMHLNLEVRRGRHTDANTAFGIAKLVIEHVFQGDLPLLLISKQGMGG
ncbi:hypothetical protein D3C85_1816160 [compost metagenome]